jgi:iron complex outermembrane receptor protein
MKTVIRLFVLVASLSACLQLTAQAPSHGVVVGRVTNIDNGANLNLARVVVVGTNMETFTNAAGDYQLANVPSGPARIQVSFTGLLPQTITVNVPADGGTVSTNFDLSATPPSEDGKLVKLDAFNVASKREVDASAIAINEQRNAANLKNVIAADAFGDSTDGNIGDFLKFIPGVNIDFVPDARAISIRGMATNFTSVTADGMRMASASSVQASRTFELEQVSLNNVARVEVMKTRTPDIAADALGGSVNLVSKSAFERNKPEFSYRTYVNLNGDLITLKKTPGPMDQKTYKVKPGADFSIIYPVSKTFGFTFSGLHSAVWFPQDRTQPLYAPTSASLPGATVQAPILRTYPYQDGPVQTTRDSLSGSIDWKFAGNNTLSLNAQYSHYDRESAQRLMNFDIGNFVPVASDPTFVQGALGRGSVSTGTGGAWRHKFGQTLNLNLKFEHIGRTWRINSALGYSHSKTNYDDTKVGYFNNVTLTLRGNPTVNFLGLDKHGYLFPDKIEVLNSTGTAPIDFLNIANYNITSANSQPDGPGIDVYKTAKTDVSRPLATSFPATIKVGAMVQQNIRDIVRNTPGGWTFVGPDHVANTADDSAGLYNIEDEYSLVAPPYAPLPRAVYADFHKVYQLYQAHPDYFTQSPSAIVQNSANGSRFLEETISAGYIMGDVKLIDSRLRLVGGVRFERTDDRGEGVVNDPNAIYQRDAQGQFVRDSAGNRVLISADPVVQTQLRFQTRAAKVKKNYQGFYPSLDATFNLTPNLLLRAAYARSIGRQDLGSIIPGTTISDVTATNPQISVNNTALQPMQTNSYDLAVEYYFKQVGAISVTAYEKEISNASGSFSQPATLALLEGYDVPDPEQYVGWNLVTRLNAGAAKITGVELDFRRNLDFEFLPRWAKGFSMFINGSQSHLQDNGLSEFNGYIARQASWGLMYGSRRLSADVKFNYRGRQRLSAQGFESGAFDYYKPRTYIDMNLSVRLTRHASFFASGRNIGNYPQYNDRFGPNTARYNAIRKVEKFGAAWTAGIKGEF